MRHMSNPIPYCIHGFLLFLNRGGARNFPTEGLALPTTGLKYGLQGVVNAKKLRQIVFYLPTGG